MGGRAGGRAGVFVVVVVVQKGRRGADDDGFPGEPGERKYVCM